LMCGIFSNIKNSLGADYRRSFACTNSGSIA
jgi:hypothetical protein